MYLFDSICIPSKPARERTSLNKLSTQQFVSIWRRHTWARRFAFKYCHLQREGFPMRNNQNIMQSILLTDLGILLGDMVARKNVGKMDVVGMTSM